MRQYNISAATKQDMDAIVSYIAQDDPHAALKSLNSFYEAMDRLVIYLSLIIAVQI